MQKNKRKNWAETIEQGLQVKESDRTSVRKIMSRLRGQSEPETQELPDGRQPESPLEPQSRSIEEIPLADTGAKMIPVQNLDRFNSGTGSNPEPVNAVQTIDSSAFEDKGLETPGHTGAKTTPVQLAPVAKIEPVQKLNRSGEIPNSVTGDFLRIPNILLDTWIPKLSPTEAVVFLRLFRLSHGFNQKTCMVGTATLATTCNISENTCRTALRRLIDLQMIRQVESINSKDQKGTTYEICFSEDFSG